VWGAKRPHNGVHDVYGELTKRIQKKTKYLGRTVVHCRRRVGDRGGGGGGDDGGGGGP